MKGGILLVCLLSSRFAFGAEESEHSPYCEGLDFEYTGSPENHEEIVIDEVLNPEERAHPDAARVLAATPGPYGHSRLGFRYLARLFRYAGRFGADQEVEDTILSVEYTNHQAKRGLVKVWDRWVVHPRKRLSVPTGPVRKLPGDGNPGMFFPNIRDRLEHTRCLKLDLGIQLCKNYLKWKQDPENGMTVRFPVSSRAAAARGYCDIYIEPWKLLEMQGRTGWKGWREAPDSGTGHNHNAR